MKICVIGSGYVGLVAGACFADTGNDVICVDRDEGKIERLKAGEIPIYEPGLTPMVERNQRDGRLAFTTDLASSVKASLINFIAVGTPPGEDGSADLGSVLAVAGEIARAMESYKIVVTKSTVPVGTADRIREVMSAVTDEDFDVVSNPEFLKEGAAIQDFVKPERIVIGTDKPAVAELMKELYAPFVRTGNPILVMDNRSAEVTKYAANAMLATRISFMNEFANLCDRVGANIDMVRLGISTDSRIGNKFLFPGVGYGGSCFPKDVKAVIRTARDHGMNLDILDAVERVNESQKRLLFERLVARFGGSVAGLPVAVWGIAFKPQTDDIREAPAMVIMESLADAGAKVRAFDPVAMGNAREVLGSRVQFCDGNYQCLEGAEALVVVTEWNEFRHPDFDRMKKLMKTPVIFDGRNIYGRKLMDRHGFEYHSLGNV